MNSILRRTVLGVALGIATVLVVTAYGQALDGPARPHPVPSDSVSPTPTPTSPPVTPSVPSWPPTIAPPTTSAPKTGMLRVYSNNIENLVTNLKSGSCRRVSPAEHLKSILVDDRGEKGGADISAPDLMLLQQVHDLAQARDYAAALARRFELPEKTYQVMLAWNHPQNWGTTHDCAERSLGRLKGGQTNAIIYNTRTLKRLGGPTTWNTGWLRPGAKFANGRGCTKYQPPSVDRAGNRKHKWKRTTSIAARFAIRGSDKTVFATSIHLSTQNALYPCAGRRDTGVRRSGIRLSPAALALLRKSELRVMGADANRIGIEADALRTYGLTGYGQTHTIGRVTKIDYLFAKGAMQDSAIDHTIAGTKSNHAALYGFLKFRR